MSLRILSGSDQVEGYLRQGLQAGRWRGDMPGRNKLAAEIGVSGRLVEAALAKLEREGLLAGQGPRRRRRVVKGLVHNARKAGMRIAFLANERVDLRIDYLTDLQHRLEEAGHVPVIAGKSMVELGMDLARIVPEVGKAGADAFLVIGGSLEVLEWFAGGKKPVFAMFGRRRGLAIAGAGPDKSPAYAQAVGELAGLGHRRIVLLTRTPRRIPEPGLVERAFLAALAAHGIPSGAYNLPDWEENAVSFHARLDALFRVTPPTALILDEVPFFMAALHFCASRGIRVPDDVSLVCTDPDPAFDWFVPSVAHIRWEATPLVRRALRWADNISRGKDDRRQTETKAEFIAGGTVGRAIAM
ncbi:substrate-binding domain-containing protein [Akkermansiaceae bacterium]|nr:substrate-binding domain-containing protein [Akkermansiaceae bacterium]